MRIGIIGSRRRTSYWDFYMITKELDTIFIMLKGLYWISPAQHIDKPCKDNFCVHIVSGGCSQGADKFAEIIADKWGIPTIIHNPEYQVYGKAATFVRNDLVAKDSDILIACVSKDRTGGTEDCINSFIRNHNNSKLIII